MGYSAGDTILDDEYNVFVNSSSDPFGYNHFAGAGAGVYGLNQSSISTVSAGDAIAASQWNALFTGMDNIANHTNVSITASSVSAGDAIAIRSALVANLASLAAAVAAGSVNATALDTAAVGSSTSASTWNGTATIERSVTFANSATMRAFFNGGGSIRIDPSCVTGIDGLKDTVFNDLTVTAIGNLDFGAHATTRSGSGETLTTNGLANGFHDISTSYVTLIKLTSDNSGYTSNTVEIFAKLNAAPATATVVTIKLLATDADGDDTFTSGNTSSVPVNPNEAPKMVLALIEEFPDDSQGLAADIRSASNTQVSNSVS
jgi:hypothetical protein|tara:strand:- start:3188 stop:4141 length:954 start_codon:yes stop_codon:yes gene_type:complete